MLKNFTIQIDPYVFKLIANVMFRTFLSKYLNTFTKLIIESQYITRFFILPTLTTPVDLSVFYSA